MRPIRKWVKSNQFTAHNHHVRMNVQCLVTQKATRGDYIMADRNSREIKEGGKRIVHSRAIKEGGKGSLKGGRFPKGEDSPNPLLPNLYSYEPNL